MIVAGEADGGTLHTSHDAGATWTTGNSTSGVWITTASSQTGSRLYAARYNSGNAYLSTDFGVTWSALSAGAADWESIATSQDGMVVAAVAQNGPLEVSTNGGATWTTRAMPDALTAHWWRAIAMSANGSVMVAVAQTGDMFRSTDSGATWHAVTVAVGGTVMSNESWYRVKLSADGQTIAAVGNSFGTGPGTGIYVSHDGGATWTRPFSLAADYTYIAMSADGQRIAVTVSNTVPGPGGGRVLLSTDGGGTFAQVPMPGASTLWRTIAMSSTGSRVYAATGAFNTSPATTGLLYLGQ